MNDTAPSGINFEPEQQEAAPQTEVAPIQQPSPGEQVAPQEISKEDGSGARPQVSDFKVPDEYKEKGWARNLKSEQDVWKMLDNAQALVGKKMVVPDLEKASQEEVEAYYSQLRPKDKDYGLESIEDEGKRALFSEMLHKNGISKKQGSDLVKQYQEYERSVLEQATSEAGFIEEMKTSFGEDYKRKGGETLAVIKQVLSEQDQQRLDQMPNSVHGIVYRMAASLAERYGAKELGLGGSAKAVDSLPVTSDSEIKTLQAELQSLSRRPHTMEERKEIVEKIKAAQLKGVK